MFLEKTQWFKSLNKYQNIMIFGAKEAAYETYLYVVDAQADISCYIVSARGDNPFSLGNKPVKVFDEIDEETKKNSLVIISQGYAADGDMREVLLNAGFRHILSGSAQVMNSISDEAREYSGRILGKVKTVREFLQENVKVERENSKICIYAVTSGKNKHSVCRSYHSDYVRYIWAGAKLSEHRPGGLTDDSGDNISELNPYFCN